jgi:hypothetical protein
VTQSGTRRLCTRDETSTLRGLGESRAYLHLQGPRQYGTKTTTTADAHQRLNKDKCQRPELSRDADSAKSQVAKVPEIPFQVHDKEDTIAGREHPVYAHSRSADPLNPSSLADDPVFVVLTISGSRRWRGRERARTRTANSKRLLLEL